MRAVIQRVREASVTIDGEEVGAIGHGYLILVGVGHEDGEEEAARLWNKIYKMRIFDDENGKTNLSIADVDGAVLIVSQFTLWANCRKGNRPSFIEAAPPQEAERLYERFVALARKDLPRVATGTFGADMAVSLINDGPFTIYLDTDEWA